MFMVQTSFAQERIVSGIVSDEMGPVADISVKVKGTEKGTVTDFDGNYSIKAKTGDTIEFTHVSYGAVEKIVGSSSKINVTMSSSGTELDEVVVTALGISREKKSLGYSTQKVSGEEVSRVKDANFVNALSGKISGVQIKSSGTMGGSTNVIIRGNGSLTGNNQALFVIDGVLINNDNSNSSNQQTGRGGYDYGNAASDINPDDIESINVLKGGAAAALYGSKAANGVIMITTKKGRAKKGLGITINSTLSLGKMDKDTYVKYQKNYGAGYGENTGWGTSFGSQDMNGDGVDDLYVHSDLDASFGVAFDPSLMIYQWDSYYPQLDTYQKATPWVAAENDPTSYFKTAITSVNNVAFSGATDKGNYKLSYTNFDQTGVLPNSSIKKNIVDFNASRNLNDKFTVSSKINYINTKAIGRYGTGYDDMNPNQSFRQWWETNVDVKQLSDAYFATHDNITWNANGPNDLSPAFTDNPYWTRYENFQNDERNRIIGNVSLDYKFNDWFNAMARATVDNYHDIQEERVAVGSHATSQYLKRLNNFNNNTYDLFLNFNKFFMDDKLNFRGLIGSTIERNSLDKTSATTTGGLVIPGLYALSNSKELSSAPYEYLAEWGRNSFFGSASFGYDNMLFLDAAYRTEKASTLPKDNNTFDYSSLSASFVFSKFIKSEIINFGKIRAGISGTGNAAPPLSVYDTYQNTGNFNGNPLYSLPATKNNGQLKDEKTNEFEAGLEMNFFKNRLGFDLSIYDKESVDNIMSVSVSNATGYDSKWVNAGVMTNKGVELSLNLKPIVSDNFSWTMNVNWSKNTNEVVSLYDDVKELQLASLQGGISINATVGQPYGTIKGYDYQYDNNGNKIIGANGQYLKSDEKVVLGDINPDWIGGINNSFRYKNFNFSFLIDVKKGGEVFSLDTWYGYGTGIYDITSFTNDLGNPVRNDIADGGGLILDGVLEDGTPNNIRVEANNYANPWGWARAPQKAHVYDAGFVKLREVALSYNFPKETVSRLKLSGLSITFTGKNLWIIDKSLPYSDPEAGLSSGNIQGYQSGAYPAVKEYGLNLNIKI